MKKLFMFIIIVTMPFLLMGCDRNNTVESDPLSFGFHHDPYDGKLIFSGIKADRKEFDVDDVELDFYYAISSIQDEAMKRHIYFDEDDEYGSYTQHCYISIIWIVSNAAVIKNLYRSLSSNNYYKTYDEILNIENTHVLKELTREEILTNDYTAEYDSSKIIYKKREKIKIPLDIIQMLDRNDPDTKTIRIMPLTIVKVCGKDKYKIYCDKTTDIYFNLIGDYFKITGGDE